MIRFTRWSRLLVTPAVAFLTVAGASACSSPDDGPVGQSVTDGSVNPSAPGTPTAASETTTVTVSGDYLGYPTVAAAWEAADAVVTVDVAASREGVVLPDFRRLVEPYTDVDSTVQYDGKTLTLAEFIDEAGSPVTLSSATVDAVFKGDVRQGAKIEVQQGGGHIAGVRYVEDGVTLLETVDADSVLLLLKELPGGVYAPLNPVVGTWRVDGDTITATSTTGRVMYGTLSTAELATMAA